MKLELDRNIFDNWGETTIFKMYRALYLSYQMTGRVTGNYFAKLLNEDK